MKGSSRTARIRRFLAWGTIAVVVGLLLVAALVAALPTIVSLPAVQGRVRQSLEKSLNRQVTWSSLAVSWSDGLAIKGLVLGDGPAPLLKGAVDEAVIVPKIGFGHGRVRVDLAVRVRTVTAGLAPGPPKPPKPYREPLTAIAEAIERFTGLDWPLPIDVGVKVAVEPVDLAFRDPQTGRRLTLGNGSLRFHMPSLADQPLAADLRGNLAVDGHRLEDLALKADLKRLVTSSRQIRPAAALVAVEATMPGSSLTVQGGLQEPDGFKARLRLDLPRVMAVAGPLLPPAVPALQGGIALDLQARADGAHDLNAVLEVNGSRIALSGGRLGRGRVGPLELRLRQKFATDHRRQQVRFADGSAAVGTMAQAAWEATVDRPSSRDRDLTVRLGPARVDLRQALAIAGPLLPPKFPVREVAGELVVRELSARLQGRRNRGEITLAGLGVSLPRLRLALARGGVAADGIDVTVDRATVPLAALQPSRLDAAISFAVRSCSVAGAQPLTLDGVRGGLQLSLTDLDLRSPSPRRVVATADLHHSLEVRRVSMERKLAVDALQGQLSARIMARESGEIEVTLPEATVSAASLQAVAAGKRLEPVPLAATLSASGVRLPAARGAAPAIERAAVTVSAGDFLRLSATAGLSGGQRRLATTEGTLRVDLDRVLPLAAVFLPKGAAAGGSSSLAWNLAAPVGRQTLPGEKNPLATARAALAMVERGEIVVSLANRSITWPLKSDTITVGELRTGQPVRLVVPGAGGKIGLDGEVAFADLAGLPGAAGRLPAQSGSLALHGELADWQSLRLHEELRIQPLGLVQRADATVGRIDTLLERQEAITAAALLQRLDATLAADVAARFPATPTPVPGGLELSGEGSAGVRIDLAAGRDLRVRATAATRDFGIRLKNGTTVEGVHADLLIDRTYGLARKEAAGWTPLSASLVRPLPEQVAAAGAAEIVNRVREDLRGQERGSRRFTIRRIATGGGRTPVVLTSLEGDLLLTPEETGLSFFQAELLGGTVRLRGMIDLKPEVPVVSAACSFSNLETFLLMPAEARQKSRTLRQDTAVTGEVSVDAPLATGQRELLEGVRMRLNLRRIGADTLERALFGLDPYERNEQLVAQRKLLRHGKLKSLRAGTLDGAFSIDGEVQVKGVDISLPRVERIRLSELPIRKQMASTVAGVVAARKALDLVRADTLVVGPKGKISLVRRGHE